MSIVASVARIRAVPLSPWVGRCQPPAGAGGVGIESSGSACQPIDQIPMRPAGVIGVPGVPGRISWDVSPGLGGGWPTAAQVEMALPPTQLGREVTVSADLLPSVLGDWEGHRIEIAWRRWPNGDENPPRSGSSSCRSWPGHAGAAAVSRKSGSLAESAGSRGRPPLGTRVGAGSAPVRHRFQAGPERPTPRSSSPGSRVPLRESRGPARGPGEGGPRPRGRSRAGRGRPARLPHARLTRPGASGREGRRGGCGPGAREVSAIPGAGVPSPRRRDPMGSPPPRR